MKPTELLIQEKELGFGRCAGNMNFIDNIGLTEGTYLPMGKVPIW